MFVLVQLCTKDINSSGKLSPGSCPLPAATNWLWMATTNGRHGQQREDKDRVKDIDKGKDKDKGTGQHRQEEIEYVDFQ